MKSIKINNENSFGDFQVGSFEVLSENPLVIYYHKVFSDEECDVITNSDMNYERAVVGKKLKKSYNRTNDVNYDSDYKFYHINSKISKLTKHDFNNIEYVQILKYNVGQEFKKHHDFFRDEDKNPRIATAITYLNEDFEGGETSFPLLNITIKPEKGSVLYFEYNNEYKDMTLHSGDKVKSGTKYIATSWIRENYADTDEFY